MTVRVRDRDEFPEIPATARELIALWAERDSRYRLRLSKGIHDGELPAILAARRADVANLELPERAAAFRALAVWRPPLAE